MIVMNDLQRHLGHWGAWTIRTLQVAGTGDARIGMP